MFKGAHFIRGPQGPLAVGQADTLASPPLGRVKSFLFSTESRPALGFTQPPIQWVPGEKRPGREADHSPLTNVEVKKPWIYTSTPHTPSWRGP
jgi:hypothetical protein